MNRYKFINLFKFFLMLVFLVSFMLTLMPTQAWGRSCSSYTYWGQYWCERYGCHWWNNSCHRYQPSCTQPNNQSDCERYGYYWYNGSCHCNPLSCESITDQTTCEATAGCYWYNNACSGTAPTCEELTSKTDCDNYGCYFWNGACHDQAPSCEALTGQSDCTDYGCYWYDGACHSESPPQPGSDVEMPCAVPPFLSNTVPPNVLIIMDNSGSMNYPAYVDLNSSNPTQYDYGSYTPTRRYYGYAEPDSFYQYSTDRFEVIHNWTGTADPANKRFSGNFLNWMMSRRIDIERQVLVGGKCASRQFSGRKTLIWEDPVQSRYFYKYWWCDDGCRWRFKNHYDQYMYAYRRSGCNYGSNYDYKWKVKKQIEGPENPEGFVQKTFDRCRYGIEHFNDSEGGYIAHWIGGPEANLVTDIENIGCDTWTPLAESFYEATRYFGAQSSYYNNDNYAAHDPIQNWCQTDFVILLTDGESTQDRNIPSWLRDYDNDGDDPIPAGANSSVYPWSSNGSDYLDDVALWAHTTDLRSDFESDQNITLYTVYCFGQSQDAVGILQRAAKNGAFRDANGNDLPDQQAEWDADGDGEPDGYYGAENGYQLESALMDIFVNIMRQTSSAAAVSVVSTSDKGEGNVFQAYFSPKRLIAGRELSWIGELHTLWIDQLGNLREDTDNDAHLDLTEDRILHIYYSQSDNATVVERWDDNNGDCEEDNLVDKVSVNDVSSVWRAGIELWNEDPDDRNIKVVVPKTTGDGYELINFKKSPDERARIKPHLDYAATNKQADSLIEYIRGKDYTSNSYWRDRTADSKVWKLADIINSSPTYVGAPADRYDLIYNDASYRPFYQKYKDRRGLVYVGANDGMLHIFNAGRYVETGSPTVRGYLDDMGDDLGKEIEAIIPFDLLPHLQWLASADYCHVFYVDLKPKAFDAKIFPSDSRHPSGWGTALICGMRFGGYTYPISGGYTYRSEYFALDITDPDHIEFLWETTDTELAFTTVYPAVAKCENKWFLVAGSGPTSFGGSSSQYAKVYVANVADLTDNTTFTGDDDAHIADPVPVDVDLDGDVDVIYVGESYWSGGRWYGRIYKILTNESDDLNDWTMSEFMDVPGPITTGGASVMDDNGRLWVYFGTGRYFSDIDESDMSDQYFFGVIDPDWNAASTVDFDDLTDVSSASIQQTDTGTYVYNYADHPISYDSLLVDINTSAGWKTTLTDGERVINRPIVIGGVVFFTTYTPNDDLCSFGGDSRLYGVDYRTGVPGETSILGMDENGWLYEFVEIGEGVPSAPAAHIGLTDQAMISVQLSTGAIAQHSADVQSPKSKGLFWRGK